MQAAVPVVDLALVASVVATEGCTCGEPREQAALRSQERRDFTRQRPSAATPRNRVRRKTSQAPNASATAIHSPVFHRPSRRLHWSDQLKVDQAASTRASLAYFAWVFASPATPNHSGRRHFMSRSMSRELHRLSHRHHSVRRSAHLVAGRRNHLTFDMESADCQFRSHQWVGPARWAQRRCRLRCRGQTLPGQ
jgi:hypothetical protein